MRRLTCLLVALLAVLLAGCGKDGSDLPGDARPGPEPEERGGAIRMGVAAFPDALDPALAYSAESWQALFNVYTPLLTYRHEEGRAGAELVPGLAEELPDVSADRRTYRLRLREGLRYADGSSVRASDFEHAVRRVLSLRSGGARAFHGIVGARAYAEAGRDRGDIAGIRADDGDREITIRLTAPDGRFANVLAMTFGAPVPATTPFRDMTDAPPPGVGAYRIAAVDERRGYTLAEVRSFDVGDLPEGTLDRISVGVIADRERLTRAAIGGPVDLMVDPPAPALLDDVRERFGDGRYREAVTSSSYHLFLNHDVAPFDDVRVRRAANLAADQGAAAKRFDGLLEPSCAFLPPHMPGHEPIDPCPYGDPSKPGDLDRARALVRRAGETGTEVVVHAPDEPGFRAVAGDLAATLRRIGLRARPRIVEASQYDQVVGRRSLRVQAGVQTVFQDYPHPATFLALFASDTDPARNLGHVSDPALDRLLARAGRNPDLDEVTGLYAAADRRLVDRAHLLPLGQRKTTALLSERLDAGEDCTVVHPVYGVDLSRLCLG